jgi:hypothetical protein
MSDDALIKAIADGDEVIATKLRARLGHRDGFTH